MMRARNLLIALLMGPSMVGCGPITVGPVDHSCHNSNCKPGVDDVSYVSTERGPLIGCRRYCPRHGFDAGSGQAKARRAPGTNVVIGATRSAR